MSKKMNKIAETKKEHRGLAEPQNAVRSEQSVNGTRLKYRSGDRYNVPLSCHSDLFDNDSGIKIFIPSSLICI